MQFDAFHLRHLDSNSSHLKYRDKAPCLLCWLWQINFSVEQRPRTSSIIYRSPCRLQNTSLFYWLAQRQEYLNPCFYSQTRPVDWPNHSPLTHVGPADKAILFFPFSFPK